MQNQEKHKYHEACGQHWHNLSEPSAEIPMVSLIKGIIHVCETIERNMPQKLLAPTFSMYFNCKGEVTDDYKTITAAEREELEKDNVTYIKRSVSVLVGIIILCASVKGPANLSVGYNSICSQYYITLLNSTSISVFMENLQSMKDEFERLEEQ